MTRETLKDFFIKKMISGFLARVAKFVRKIRERVESALLERKSRFLKG